jgi:polynucleotide 5'-kinase involved in rRNA processing
LYNINDVNKIFKKLSEIKFGCFFVLVNTDGMDILNSKKFKQNQIKDIVKPQPVVGNKEKHPTLLRGKINKTIRI